VSQVVNDALRRELLAPDCNSSRARVSIPVYGQSMSLPTDTTPAELDALLHEEEARP